MIDDDKHIVLALPTDAPTDHISIFGKVEITGKYDDSVTPKIDKRYVIINIKAYVNTGNTGIKKGYWVDPIHLTGHIAWNTSSIQTEATTPGAFHIQTNKADDYNVITDTDGTIIGIRWAMCATYECGNIKKTTTYKKHVTSPGNFYRDLINESDVIFSLEYYITTSNQLARHMGRFGAILNEIINVFARFMVSVSENNQTVIEDHNTRRFLMERIGYQCQLSLGTSRTTKGTLPAIDTVVGKPPHHYDTTFLWGIR